MVDPGDATGQQSDPGARVAVTVDVVALTRRDELWEVLLVTRAHPPFAGRWALPGGFIEPGETLEDSAWRELAEETGLEREELQPRGVRLEQLGAYGDPGRDPRGRTVTIAFVAVLPDAPDLAAGSDAADARFWAVEDLAPGGGGESLAFDHDRVLFDALAWIEGRPL